MDNWKTGFAKMFRDRDNQGKIGNVTGKVISPIPNLQISILDGNAILDNDDLYCCNQVLIKLAEETVTVDGTQLTILKKEEETFNIGDEILLVPDETESKWFIVDKVTKF